MMQIEALPTGLILEHHAVADSPRAEAIRRARAGAEEGTLVVVERPRSVGGRRGKTWQMPEPPGLHAALILRPGLPAEECAELGPVTLVALGSAFSGLVAPMTELHYRWPNDILLNTGKVASVWLDGAGPAEALDWLVISWVVNTDTAPATLGHDAAALGMEGGIGAVDHGELLQAIARELLAAITTWDESGFERTLQRWRTRTTPDELTRYTLADGHVVAGTVDSIDDAGGLVLRESPQAQTLALNAFFGLPTEAE